MQGEHDEAMELALLDREVAEETGIRVGIDVPESAMKDWQLENRYEIFEHWRWKYGPDVTHNTERVFSLEVPKTVTLSLSPREHLAFEWHRLGAAAGKCFSPSNQEAILRLPDMLSRC